MTPEAPRRRYVVNLYALITGEHIFPVIVAATGVDDARWIAQRRALAAGLDVFTRDDDAVVAFVG